ncbi:MAG: hydrogenase maturation nickel metallochaperone HypA [Chloroflexi bacterium RBG_16_54_18]|nr:MAG: hydrogenase maturation nickel metallochaperone HypA [Chloroflexi bacterium RBG_16_54_18]
MHELAVTQHILDIALRHATQAQATRITDLYLVIGQLSSIVDDSVQFYWEILTQETPAKDSRLHFERVPAELCCLDCEQEFYLNGADLVCPQCAGVHIKIITGEEFLLEAIEVET